MTYVYKKYPMSLYRDSRLGDHVIVKDEAEEAEWRAKGFANLNEIEGHEPAPVVQAELEAERRKPGRPPKAR